MVVNANQESTPDSHPLDSLVNDPTGREPLCDREMFGQVMQLMADAMAPRLFAIMQEYGDRVDARCAAWGLAFDDHADAFGVNGGSIHTGVRSAQDMLRYFRFGTHIKPHLVWITPEKPEC